MSRTGVPALKMAVEARALLKLDRLSTVRSSMRMSPAAEASSRCTVRGPILPLALGSKLVSASAACADIKGIIGVGVAHISFVSNSISVCPPQTEHPP